MTAHHQRAYLVVLLAVGLWPAAASAEAGTSEVTGKRTVVANGSSTIQRKPTQLRLSMQLTGKGKTIEEALAKLKNREEGATAQLETLKADKKSIVFGAPSVSNDQSSRKQRIQAMVIAQMRSRGKKAPKGLLTPQTVSVAATLTARWPLETTSHEKTLLLAQSIQEKIKAADLAGAKEVEKLSPEEEEFQEEASQMANQYGEEAQQPGQARFLFVAVLTKAEREKAMAEAFAKAKEQAAALAKAAGEELGPLVGLAGDAVSLVDFNINSSSEPAYMCQMAMAGQQTDDESDVKEEETTSANPSGLKFNFRVTATFQLGK